MISIIVPALNEEKYLPKLLESIKNQKIEEEYEIIVADANSKDKTKEIAKNFGCKIVQGGLPAKGRNQGAKIARGEILLFLDADTVLPPNFLKKALEEFKKRKLKVASFKIFSTNKKIIYKLIFGFYNFWIILTEKILPHGDMAILIYKDIHFKINGFDQNIVFAENVDYVRRASKFGKFGIIKSVVLLTSPRRFEKDGIIATCLKNIVAEIYMLIFGPIKKEIFKYQFNHYENHSF